MRGRRADRSTAIWHIEAAQEPARDIDHAIGWAIPPRRLTAQEYYSFRSPRGESGVDFGPVAARAGAGGLVTWDRFGRYGRPGEGLEGVPLRCVVRRAPERGG